MTLHACGWCPCLLFVVFHHWPVDSNKSFTWVLQMLQSSLSKPPRVFSPRDFDGQLRISRLSSPELKSPCRWSLRWALIIHRLSGRISPPGRAWMLSSTTSCAGPSNELVNAQSGCVFVRFQHWRARIAEHCTCHHTEWKWCSLCSTVRWNKTHFRLRVETFQIAMFLEILLKACYRISWNTNVLLYNATCCIAKLIQHRAYCSFQACYI